MRRLLPIVAFAVAASCSSPFEASELAGTYTAYQIRGESLPYTYSIIDAKRITLIADSVILRPDGTGRFGRTSEIVDQKLGTSEIERMTLEFAYTIDGSTLDVHEPCHTACIDLTPWSMQYLIVGDKLMTGALVLEKQSAAQ